MKTLLAAAFALLFTGLAAVAAGPEKITDMKAALAKAKTENKLLFLQIGRADCENCEALRTLVAKKKVELPVAKFVYADVNWDDSTTQRLFRHKFKVIGDTLPFVVVAAPDGTQLGAHAGPGTADDFEKLIHDASKKVAGPKS